MAQAMTLLRTGDLYPPQCSQGFFDFLLNVAEPGDERDASGNFVLRRDLTRRESETLRARDLELAPWLVGGGKDDVLQEVAEMLVGFGGGAMSIEEAGVKAIQYRMVLAGLPLWAVRRACMRFARNEVSDDELGKGERWSRSFGPSTAHLRTVARDLVAPFAKESRRIKMTLNGTARRRPVSAEERARGDAAAAAWLAQSGARRKESLEAERLEKMKRRTEDERLERGREELVLREYRAAGVEPPERKPGKVIPSLSVMLQLGWTVEDHPEGGRVLIAPPPPKRERRETRPNEMGS